MIIMYINNTKEVVKTSQLVSDEEILATIFDIAPQMVFTPLLNYDFFNYIATIPTHCNNIILQYFENSEYRHIISHYFIEVCEDGSFDYEYGDICATHHCLTSVGYVRRTPQTEALAYEDYDDDYY